MIILTTLGLGQMDKVTGDYKYSDETYMWADKPFRTSLFQAALADWFQGAKMIVLATAEARRVRSEELLRAIPSASIRDIPDGRSPDEYWAIFNAVADAVPPGEEVILDVTHGLRSLPILSLLALAFLRVGRKDDSDKVRISRVLYGAREARTNSNDPVPVFDLSPFLAMLDWANATQQFLDTGDARPMQELLIVNRKSPLAPLSESLSGLSKSLFAGRQQFVRGQADELIVNLKSALDEGHLSGPARPYALLANRISDAYGPLKLADGSTAAEELQATWQLVKWYVDREHYMHATTLAREWCVSVRCWKCGGDFRDPKERSKHENWLGAAAALRRSKDAVIAADWDEFVKLWHSVQDLRNDVAHYKDKSGADAVLKNVDKLPAKLQSAAKRLGLEVGP